MIIEKVAEVMTLVWKREGMHGVSVVTWTPRSGSLIRILEGA